MLQTLLPALIPSWRFFDTIGPSPRIEYAVLTHAEEAPGAWQPFRAIPQRLSWRESLLRLLWNPRWNESLYMTRCAEKLLEEGSIHAEAELGARICRDLRSRAEGIRGAWLVYRIIIVQRRERHIVREPAFYSQAFALIVNEHNR